MTAPTAQVLLDAAGALSMVDHRAGELFGVTADDVGSPFQDLALSYRPVGLRSAVDGARASGSPVWVRDVAWRHDGEDRTFDVAVTPLAGSEHRVLGTSIVFTDTIRERALAGEFEHASARLATAHEELQSTHEDLRVTGDEAVGIGGWALAALGALGSTGVVLDAPAPSARAGRGGRVRLWNAASAQLWGVRADEAVGADLADLDVGLPVEAVVAACAAVLDDGAPRELALEGVERHGRTVALRVRVSALRDAAGQAAGTVVTVEADGGAALRPRSG